MPSLFENHVTKGKHKLRDIFCNDMFHYFSNRKKRLSKCMKYYWSVNMLLQLNNYFVQITKNRNNRYLRSEKDFFFKVGEGDINKH